MDTEPTKKPRIRYGTSSWSEKSWVGAFYPPGTKPADFLTFYATEFDTVEADTTYYHIPSRELVRGWDRKTPAGFVIASKFPRSIVHGGENERPDPARVLVEDAVSADTLQYIEAMCELGPKCGPLVIQFPYFNQSVFPNLHAFLGRLEPFLDRLPVGPRYAVEVRNKNWFEPELFEALRHRRVGFVLVDLAYLPHPAALARRADFVTSDFLYVRLIGDRKAVEAQTKTFDRVVIDQGAKLDRWAALLRELSPRVRETFAYANNHFAGYGPATIRELARKIDAPAGGT